MLLQAHRTSHGRLRADKLDLGCFTDLGEIGVLAQKAVAGMNRIDIRNFSGTDHRRYIQVAARAFCRPNTNGLIGEAYMQAVAVSFRIYRHGLYAQILAGTNNAYGDFAAIGD